MALQQVNEIIVSVCMITYNHENYISQAIEGVLIQKTSFPIELIIGEDYSSDETKKICNKYVKLYPNKIKLLPSEKNIGMTSNFIKTMKECKGKYIALCEGDDYWIDPHKLQKQIDFLEANPEYSLCFHEVLHIWEDKSHQPHYIIGNKKMKEWFTAEDIIPKDFTIATDSMCFRRECLNGLFEWCEEIDLEIAILTIWLSTKGKVKYLDEMMSVYRKNSGSVSYGQTMEYANEVMTKRFDCFNKNTGYKYNTAIVTKKKMMKQSLYTSRIKKRYGFLYYLIYPKKIINFILRNFINRGKL